MVHFFIPVICAVILTELLTELVVKSIIFAPIRKFLGKSNWLKQLTSCGYCFSVWVAFVVVFFLEISYSLTGNTWMDLVLMSLMVHRFSNYLHNVVDKYTDKYYDVRYVNTQKEGN